MKDLGQDLGAFGIECERQWWHEAAQKVGRCFQRAEEGAEAYVRQRREQRQSDDTRRLQPRLYRWRQYKRAGGGRGGRGQAVCHNRLTAVFLPPFSSLCLVPCSLFFPLFPFSVFLSLFRFFFPPFFPAYIACSFSLLFLLASFLPLVVNSV